MDRVLVIGIGPGDPELMTVKAIRALNEADLILIPLKGEEKDDLAELRREICRQYLGNGETQIIEFALPSRRSDEGYIAGVNDWHDGIAKTYEAIIAAELPDAGTLALLVWGDPSLYDSTHRILDRLRSREMDFSVEVVPGITSVQALTSRHAMPLNALGGSVLYTTGRKLREGVPADVDTVVVMLDGEMSFRFVPPEAFEIFWGAYLGMESEIALSGPLSEVSATIETARATSRDEHGWIMDIYILKRRGSR